MDKIIETEGIGGRPLLCDHTEVSSKDPQKHLTTPTSLEMLKKSLRSAGEIQQKHVRRKHSHALFDSDRRRPADHDGATRPLRSAVLLLPPGRSGSRDPPVAADGEEHQLCFRAREVEA